MQQHRAVLLSEDVLPDLDGQVGAHAQDMPVEGGVMALAEGEADESEDGWSKLRGGDTLVERHKLRRSDPGFPDVSETPAYSIADAARYVMIPSATLRSWVAGRYYPVTHGRKKYWRPLIKPPEKGPPWYVSFRNLAEAHVLATLRRQHGVSMEAVRHAISYVEEKLGDPHPLVNPHMRTDGISLFLQRYGRLEQVSQDGQFAIQEVLEMSLERLDWGPAGVLRLYPFTRGGAAARDWPKVVVIDPRVSFGKPVVIGTRVPTTAIFERWTAGDSFEDLVRDFELSSLQVQEAIRCEQLKEAA